MSKKITQALGIKDTGRYGFVNNYPSKDVELYIDYGFIKNGVEKGKDISDFDVDKAYNKIIDFFNTAFSNSRVNNLNLENLLIHEVNETHFGLTDSDSKSKGKGPSEDSLISFVNRVTSNNIDINILKDPDIFKMLTPRIGPDYFSDLITNIIFQELYDFTKRKIQKLNVGSKLGKSSKKTYRYWDLKSHKWNFKEFDTFVIDNFDVIMVPTQITSNSAGDDVGYFVNDIIVQIKRNKELKKAKKTHKKARTKNQILEEGLSDYDSNKMKNYALDSIAKKPSILDEYNPYLHSHKMKDDNDFKN